MRLRHAEGRAVRERSLFLMWNLLRRGISQRGIEAQAPHRTLSMHKKSARGDPRERMVREAGARVKTRIFDGAGLFDGSPC